MRRLDHPNLDEVALAQALSALGDPVRLAIVRMLSDGEEHQGSKFAVKVSQSTLSHHFSTLRNACVVFIRPEGTRCRHSLRPEFDHRFPGLLGTVLALR
ncbi:ArsR/SmtB family transcription factor [Amycolatopsis ultiminotia]|uniref:ArsR/SmtB family transcription factor n=1 Tax=Amycolatopsis ultiminotia TaxID=543629 RepID=UPI0031EAADAA